MVFKNYKSCLDDLFLSATILAAGTGAASFAASRQSVIKALITTISYLQNSSSSKDIVDGPVVVVKNETATSRPKKNENFYQNYSAE